MSVVTRSVARLSPFLHPDFVARSDRNPGVAVLLRSASPRPRAARSYKPNKPRVALGGPAESRKGEVSRH